LQSDVTFILQAASREAIGLLLTEV